MINASHEYGQKPTVLMDVVSRSCEEKDFFWFCPQAVRNQMCLVTLVFAQDVAVQNKDASLIQVAPLTKACQIIEVSDS